MSLRFVKATLAAVSAILAFSVVSSFANASDTLDIQQELSMPGVKLVVVEFYSVYCKPCMEAVPKWKALHNKYSKNGLRFIVVSADEDVCSKPPDWAPDKSICDTKGELQEKMNIKGALPTSFLFSWEGNLAIKSHTVEPVDEAIRRYFGETHYKVVVEPVEVYGDKYAISSNPEWVRDEVIKQLGSRSKFDVVGRGAARTQAQGSDICKADFPPNSTLRIKLQGFGSGERVLSLELEKDGCVKGKSTQQYKGSGIEEDRESLRQAVGSGVAEMLGKLLHNKIQKPRLVGGRKDGKIGVVAVENEEGQDQEEVVVKFESDPSGAVLLLDGKILCKSTPCSKRVVPGSYKASMQAENYIEKSGDIQAKKGAVVSWKLDPDFGWLSVTSEPSGLDVKIDGEIVGKTPLQKRPVRPKTHEVLVVSDCYYEIGERATVDRGQERKVAVQPIQKTGKVKVTAADKDGNDIEADVFIDGTNVGTAPGIFKANVCAKEIEVKAAKLGSYKVKLAVAEKQTIEVAAVLKGGGDGSVDGWGIEWVSIPGGSFMMWCSLGDSKCEDDEKPRHSVDVKEFSIMSHEVTQGEYKSVIGSNPSNFSSCGNDCPVEKVNWNEAKAFCKKVGGRLPTEAEWEYAARAGTTTKYYCGDSERCLDGIAWYDKNSSSKTHQVKQKQPNAWGLYDMSGNVWEWVEDCYSKGFNASPDCSFRVLRGGSWFNVARNERVTGRLRNLPVSRYYDVGFRCSRD